MGNYTPRIESDRRQKKYVEVICDFSSDGAIKPLVIVWDTGVRYEIDRVLEVRQAHSLKTGGTGMRYTIRVGGTVTHLWLEGSRWFVEAKAMAMPEER